MSNTYTIQQFTVEDWQTYKSMRLEALRLEQGVFGGNYTDESARSDDEWKQRFSKPCAYFGLYHESECIGLTGIVEHKDNPQDTLLIASYIRKEHRGKGLSRLLYEARIGWAKEHGYKRVIVSHRATNLASKAANQKHGFTYTHAESKTWPDGKLEDNVFYELIL
jgi:RimJ/RimL family protein N-acetyltransferase